MAGNSDTMETQTTKAKFSSLSLSSPEKDTSSKRLRTNKQVGDTPKTSAKEKTDSNFHMEDLKMALQPIHSAIQGFSTQLTDFGKTLKQITDRMDTLEGKNHTMEIQIDSINKDLCAKDSLLTEIQDKLLDLEARSRRNNILIRGLPESYDNQDLLKITKQIFSALLTLDSDSENLVVERAHRAIRSRQVTTVPRLIYTKILNFQDAQKILVTARKHRQFVWNNHKLTFSQDLPHQIKLNRQKLSPYCADLIKRGIKFQMRYPNALTFTYKDKRQSVNTVQEAQDTFLKLFKVVPTTT